MRPGALLKRAAQLTLALATGLAGAHGGEAHRSAAPAQVETAFGRTGDPKSVSRTIRVDMSDAMRFFPATLTVRVGETVRIVAANRGQVLHEFVIGTATELEAHAEQMKRFPGMEHDEPFMAHVSPGKTGEIVWQFTTPGEFHFACLLPGHYEAGMRGQVTVLPARR